MVFGGRVGWSWGGGGVRFGGRVGLGWAGVGLGLG